jgi:hypothetical protein
MITSFRTPKRIRSRRIARDGIGHVGGLADSLEDEVARLEAAGLAQFHTGQIGPVSAVWFDGGPLLGHPIEVLQRRDELLGFYDMLSRASEEWDGLDPYGTLEAIGRGNALGLLDRGQP